MPGDLPSLISASSLRFASVLLVGDLLEPFDRPPVERLLVGDMKSWPWSASCPTYGSSTRFESGPMTWRHSFASPASLSPRFPTVDYQTIDGLATASSSSAVSGERACTFETRRTIRGTRSSGSGPTRKRRLSFTWKVGGPPPSSTTTSALMCGRSAIRADRPLIHSRISPRVAPTKAV